MWKVKNQTNTPFLYYYNKHVIIEFFKFWLELSQIPNIGIDINNDKFLDDYLKIHKNIDLRFLKINKSIYNKIVPLTIKIVKLGYASLISEFELYKQQNREIYRGNYNLSAKKHPKCLTVMFKDYFYDKFWSESWIWIEIVKRPFSREKYQENFKIENNISVCPYCDADTITSNRNGWIEHFLPKGKYPYLAANPKNLIPTCTACNVSGSGKGTSTVSPITTQFNSQIGDLIKFKLLTNSIHIEINTDPEIENYLKLLKLRKRYEEKNTHRSVIRCFQVNYETMCILNDLGEYDETDYIEYLRKIGKENKYYFVQKSLIPQASEIITGS